MKVLSLFANIGVAEAYLEDIGFEVILANEIDKRRAALYQKIYPNSNMICGDIQDENVFNKIVKLSIESNIDVILATPPCQGMSTAGQQKLDDERNNLIIYTLNAVKKIKPKYVLIENVPQFLKTSISFNGEDTLIVDAIKNQLSKYYEINFNVVDSKNYNVAQTRERAIVLLSRKDQTKKWKIPEISKNILTLENTIGHLPPIDPFIKDISEVELLKKFPNFHKRKQKALKISKWHNPPHHVLRQVNVMEYTPTGKSAFENDNIAHRPTKKNGELVKGFKNTYKRQNWDTPAYTITMDNVKISSQNNVHPGRKLGNDKNGNTIYSDPRTLTLYEIMKIMSIPDNWAIPQNTSEAFLRRVIGEGIPPMMIRFLFNELRNE
ncbi:DNA cytosine methyltransferase [Flavobacterium adhaerens]|uniref:DNA cytosine methyltransferase n=1 Tax=Flavobacterium adhaerens TaxID=3149043 RepID=UPI0032B41E13